MRESVRKLEGEKKMGIRKQKREVTEEREIANLNLRENVGEDKSGGAVAELTQLPPRVLHVFLTELPG